MGKWSFSCTCSLGRFDGPGTLVLDATDEADAHQKARDAGWLVDWDKYPCVACSQACWEKASNEWERSRPAREVGHAESRSKHVGKPCDASICELYRAGESHMFGSPGCVYADHHCDACHVRGQCNIPSCLADAEHA